MRIFVVKQATDLQSLSSQLFVGGNKPAAQSAGRNAALEGVKLLNSHVDLRRIEAGTVLLLPDSPELGDNDSRSITDDAFADFADRITDGLTAVTRRVSAGAKALADDRKSFANALKTVKRHQSLSAQIKYAEAEFDDVQKRVDAAVAQVETMNEVIKKELKALGSLLR